MQSMKLDRTPTAQVGKMKMFKVRSEAWGAAGYIIRRDLAARLAMESSHFYEPVDWLLFHPRSAIASEVNVFQLDPAPCVQDQYHPDIEARKNFDKATEMPTGWVHSSVMLTKRAFSPLVRKVIGKRSVPFA
jgi:GR25 family glycosyltransferase involved in LPS biosynthesis